MGERGRGKLTQWVGTFQQRLEELCTRRIPWLAHGHRDSLCPVRRVGRVR